VENDRWRDVYLVGDEDAAGEIFTAATALLRDRDEGCDAVARVAELDRQKCVVEVELAHRDGIRPRSPLRVHAGRRFETEKRRTSGTGMRQGLGPGRCNRWAVDGGERDCRVVHNAASGHGDGYRVEGCPPRGERCDGPGQLPFPREPRGRRVHPYDMFDQGETLRAA
jgi:hypothetical protein